jgi:hypothetical protein
MQWDGRAELNTCSLSDSIRLLHRHACLPDIAAIAARADKILIVEIAGLMAAETSRILESRDP